MRYYRIHGEVVRIEYKDSEEHEKADGYLESYWFRNMVFRRTLEINERFEGKAFLSASAVESDTFELCALSKTQVDLAAEAKAYLNDIGVHTKVISVKEVTFDTFSRLLHHADGSCFIDDDDDVLDMFDLSEFSRRRCYLHTPGMDEDIIEIRANKEDDRKCARLLTATDLKEEITRIRQLGCSQDVHGHPVHYLISTDDKETQKETFLILLNNLIKSGRLGSKRYCTLDCTRDRDISETYLDAVFRMNGEGAIIAPLLKPLRLDGSMANSAMENIEKLCECVRRHRNEVLTIFLLPKECSQIKSFLFDNLGSLSFVEMNEKPADGKRARRLLSAMAKDSKVTADETLFSKIEPGETYLTKELRFMFEDWFSDKLRTSVYPQYAQFRMVKTDEAEKEATGTAYEDLMSMVGLDDAKKIICQAIDFHKMQKFLLNQDITRERPAQHMVFTGNPGTAKTTAARLFARIMRENELLSSGHIVEVGRADLVGKYVGHTAPLVQQSFRRAKGGVLFIDEAYSLVDGGDGNFGDEAINTIVQEMENHRDEVVVIFAGYPDKMELFLDRNPGLRSRIAFHVPFPDYTTEELCEIAELVAMEKGMRLAEDAKEKLADIFETAREEEDYGNGRFVRSTIEKAMMAQASRIVKGSMEALKKSELSTLVADDIEMPKRSAKKPLKLGFCA